MEEEAKRAVGPGSVDEVGIAPPPLLAGMTELEYVEILNPLSDDFVGKFSITRPVSAPITIGTEYGGRPVNEQEAMQRYGAPPLRNPDRTGRAHIVNTITIPSGKTARVRGDAAQVILKQLIDEVMSREGKKLLRADRFARHQYETRLVMTKGTVDDILGYTPKTATQQMDEALRQQEATTEPEFPQLKEVANEKSEPELRPAASGSPDGSEPASEPAHVFVGGDNTRKKGQRGRRAKAQPATG